MQVSSDAISIAAGSMAGAPKVRGKVGLVTLDHLDGRTTAAKRANELAAMFEKDIGMGITDGQRLAARRAVILVAIAEDTASRRLAGEAAVSVDDVVRADGAASRAMKALGLDQRREPASEPLRGSLAGCGKRVSGLPWGA